MVYLLDCISLSLIGLGYQQLYQSFQYFFDVQDPLLNMPPKV